MIETALDDEKWLRRGVRPFERSIDDWPAQRAFWLDVVMSIREQVEHQKAHETQSDAEYEQWKQQRAQQKGMR